MLLTIEVPVTAELLHLMEQKLNKRLSYFDLKKELEKMVQKDAHTLITDILGGTK